MVNMASFSPKKPWELYIVEGNPGNYTLMKTVIQWLSRRMKLWMQNLAVSVPGTFP